VYRQGIARGTADCRHFALQKKGGHLCTVTLL
jgi:hypothetical protein